MSYCGVLPRTGRASLSLSACRLTLTTAMPRGEDLVTPRLGRWLCLSGAPQTSNTTATPCVSRLGMLLTSAALREIARRVSIGWRFFHEQ